jgi:hypothetical protein
MENDINYNLYGFILIIKYILIVNTIYFSIFNYNSYYN